MSKPSHIIEPNYFSNWGDLWFPKWANKLLKPAAKISWLTPNHVTIFSFLCYSGALIANLIWPNLHLLFAFILAVSYIFDCLDGQLARFTGKTSTIGDYMDKTLDVFKLFVINFSISLAAYHKNHKALYIYLGFVSCFAFMFRYYIKLETMFSAISRDPEYLAKSRERRWTLYAKFDEQKKNLHGVKAHLKWWAFRNHSLLAFDEAEHVIFGALALATGLFAWWCWLFAIAQGLLVLARLVERGWQLNSRPESLTYPLRK